MNVIANSQEFTVPFTEAFFPLEILDSILLDRDIVCSTCIHGLTHRYQHLSYYMFILYQAEDAILDAEIAAATSYVNNVNNVVRINDNIAFHTRDDTTICLVYQDQIVKNSFETNGAEVKSVPPLSAMKRVIDMSESGNTRSWYPAGLGQIMVELSHLHKSKELYIACADTVIGLLITRMSPELFAQYVWCNTGRRKYVTMTFDLALKKANNIVRWYINMIIECKNK